MTTGRLNIQQNINNLVFKIYVNAPFTVSLNISASSDRRRMRHSSLESPRHAASNGGSFILLRPLDAEIFNESIYFFLNLMLYVEFYLFHFIFLHIGRVSCYNYLYSSM